MTNGYKFEIIKWTCIGVLIRLALMPFTMHGQDLLFINYFPTMFVERGIWDPYGFITSHFPYFPYTYYGPFLFIIMSIWDFIIIKCFGCTALVNILDISGVMMFKEFTTSDYVNAFASFNLFWNLSLMKAPYLIFDFLTGFILLKLAVSMEQALASYRLWMLNIVVLHSAYAIGQFDLIAAFFIISAVSAAVRKRPHMAVVFLSLGGATKVFPYILIPVACVLLGDCWKKRLQLILTAMLTAILLYMPFYLSSGSAIFGIFKQGRYYEGLAKWIFISLFTLSYSFILWAAVKDSRKEMAEQRLIFYFLVTGFLAYAANPISFRYFVFITPMLALFLPGRKKIYIFMIVVILMLAFLRLPERESQMGLFLPLNPEYFMAIPTLQEIIGRYVNIELLYKVMARTLALLFLICAIWIWNIKEECEKRRLWITI